MMSLCQRMPKKVNAKLNKTLLSKWARKVRLVELRKTLTIKEKIEKKTTMKVQTIALILAQVNDYYKFT